MYVISHGESGRCIIANAEIQAGSRLFSFDPGCFQKEKTYQTIQVGPDKHCLVDSDVTLLNHSCNPNLIVDTSSGFIYAQKNINPGEELNYFYPSTEWDMARPFVCNCRNPECIGIVKGAYWTPLSILSAYYLNRHIVELLITHIKSCNSLSKYAPVKCED